MFDLIPIKDDCEKVYIEFNGERVGKLNYYFTEKIVMIKYLLIFDEYKRKGIATKFIKFIKSCHTGKILYGDALPDAVKFWESIGVEFSTPIPSKIRSEVLLTPFKIEC